jgi:hypothetical protein
MGQHESAQGGTWAGSAALAAVVQTIIDVPTDKEWVRPQHSAQSRELASAISEGSSANAPEPLSLLSPLEIGKRRSRRRCATPPVDPTSCC